MNSDQLMNGEVAQEDFSRVRRLYDVEMPDNNLVHDVIYPRVFGSSEYIGQFSDNSASEILAMARAMKLNAGAKVLDIGCGAAAVAILLAKRLDWKVTGIDLSAASLRRAHLRMQAEDEIAPVSLLEGSVYDHSFDHLFDGVYATGSFCHFEAGRLFHRCKSLLRPGGTLAFMERVRTGVIGREEWKSVTEEWVCPSVYSVAEYQTLLQQAGFADVLVQEQTDAFRRWQSRSVEVRTQMRAEIVRLTSLEYFETSLRLAACENDLTRTGLLGYARFVAVAE